MPTLWREVGQDAYSKFQLTKRTIVELEVYDDKCNPQGTAIVGILADGKISPQGISFEGQFLGASDQHYQHWMMEGEGAAYRASYGYHLCLDTVKKCKLLKKKPLMIHSTRFRVRTPSDVKEGRTSWLRSASARSLVAQELDNFYAVVGGAPQGFRKAEEPEDPEEGSEEDCSSDAGSSDSEEVQKKLKRLQAELAAAEKRARKRDDKKKKKEEKEPKKEVRAKGSKPKEKDRSPSKGGEKKRSKKEDKEKTKKRKRKDRSSPADPKAAKKEKKQDGKKRKKKDDQTSEEELPGSSGDELFKSAKPKKTTEKEAGADRGPFGGGPAFKYKTGDDDSDSDDGSVFREAPAKSTCSSGQQKLTRYSRKYPGRLASRLLLSHIRGNWLSI